MKSILLSITAFVSTNMDDLFINMLFFAQHNTKASVRSIVAGKYLGMGALTLISLLGAYGLQMLPGKWLSLLGLFPLALGVREMIRRSVPEDEMQPNDSRSLCLSMALITIANGAEYRFIDDARLMGDLDDPWVLTTSDEAEAFVRSLPPNPLQAEYYVFTNPIKTMAGLSETGKSWLTDLWTNERTKHRVVMVAGIEAMRTKGYVESWYLFFKQSGAGLWIGTGFGNQMIFQYGRTMPEFNQPAGPTDGFVSFRGQVVSVRLLEPAQADDTGANA